MYPSNLSAALYELGDYSACVAKIIRSWELMQLAVNQPLALRLSSRLAKALCHGVQAGSILPEQIWSHSTAIDQLEAVVLQVSDSNAQSQDCARLWKQWRIADSGDRSVLVSDALSRLSRVPISRVAP